MEKLLKFTFDSFPRDSENTITKEFHIMDGLMEMKLNELPKSVVFLFVPKNSTGTNHD